MTYQEWKKLEKEVRDIISENVRDEDSDSWTTTAILILEHIDNNYDVINIS